MLKSMNQAKIGMDENIIPDKEVDQAVPKNSEQTKKIGKSDIDQMIKQFSLSKTSNENICDKCKKSFKTRKILKRHIIDIHIGFTRECQVCKKQIKDGGFRKHMRHFHENPKKYPCSLCDKVLSSKGTLKQHCIDVHDKIRKECEISEMSLNHD